MTKNELNESIPPAYTEHIGRQIVAHLERNADEPRLVAAALTYYVGDTRSVLATIPAGDDRP